jgi:ABC-type uncharacterized transport system ATPase subunit
MGSSGAGETMLMDVVAGRKTVGKSGSIMVDDTPKIQSELTKSVFESLEFSANVRLPMSASKHQRIGRVCDGDARAPGYPRGCSRWSRTSVPRR